jgi:DNA-binding transcriptional LysR family regulator
MEMHQVRYFLAVARVLNFTRAAEECHVAQPSLTRAIKQLEEELGGELFRRERNLSHLTEFGQRMQPFMQQCYDSAAAAKVLATSLKSGAVAPLTIAISNAVNIALIVPHLTELTRTFKGLELSFLRGGRDDVSEYLKKGEAEIALCGPFAQVWERLDDWPLFTEPYLLAVNENHAFADRVSVKVSDLSQERILTRTYCELVDHFNTFLKDHQVSPAATHRIVAELDFVTLVEAGLGLGLMPASAPQSSHIKRLELEGLVLNRTIHLYGVSGRQRSAPASALIKLLRAGDWSAYAA